MEYGRWAGLVTLEEENEKSPWLFDEPRVARVHTNYNNCAPLLESAIRLRVVDGYSYGEVELKTGIPKSTVIGQVRRALKNKPYRAPGGQSKLTADEQVGIVRTVIGHQLAGYGMRRLEVMDLMRRVLVSRKGFYGNPKSPNINTLPSRRAYYNLLSLHPEMSMRTPTSVSHARASAMNHETIQVCFNNWEELLKKHPDIARDPSRIWNEDEMGVNNLQPNGKVLAGKGMRRVWRFGSDLVNHLSLACIVNAAGDCGPLAFIFKGALHLGHAKDGPPNALYASSGSGFINNHIFILLLKQLRRLRGPRQIIIVDGHSSHKHPDIMQWCADNEFYLFFLLANCTAFLQMLDVAVFGPLKRALRSILEEYAKKGLPAILREDVIRSLTRRDPHASSSHA